VRALDHIRWLDWHWHWFLAMFLVRRAAGSSVSGRSSSRRLQAAAARNGGQGRRCLAPGPEPRGPARTRRLAGSTGSMARTHPLTGVSTVAPTPALAHRCFLSGPAARSHGAASTLSLARAHALGRVREGFSIGFKCSEAFLQAISMCYPVDNQLLGRVSQLLGRTTPVDSQLLGRNPTQLDKVGLALENPT